MQSQSEKKKTYILSLHYITEHIEKILLFSTFLKSLDELYSFCIQIKISREILRRVLNNLLRKRNVF